MNSEDFLEKFNEGKINFKLPSKYPENFSVCKTYSDGKRDIPLTNRDKVEKILKDCYAAVKPIVKKFKLSLALLIESEVNYKGVAWTKKIKVNFSSPGTKDKKEELFAYTNMIQIKIRNKEFPQNAKKFLNKTTVLAIMLHELAHLRQMNHSIDFALFLQEIYLYAMTLGLFTESEEHMIPSSRPWERRMFETKGQMTREELDEFFKDQDINNKDDSLEHEHGEELEKEKDIKLPVVAKSEVAIKNSNTKAKHPLKANDAKINNISDSKERIQKALPTLINRKTTLISQKDKSVILKSKTSITFNNSKSKDVKTVNKNKMLKKGFSVDKAQIPLNIKTKETEEVNLVQIENDMLQINNINTSQANQSLKEITNSQEEKLLL